MRIIIMQRHVLLAFFFMIISCYPAFGFSGAGAGTSGDPYIITDCTQLNETRLDLLAYYRLGNDINCSDTINWNNDYGRGFEPIGNYVGFTNIFEGSFDGNNHKIIDLFINSTLDYAGLFGVITNTYVTNIISNVSLVNVNVSGGNYGVGALVGYQNAGNILNSHSSGKVSSTIGNVGGLIGVFGSGSCSGSSSSVNVHGATYVGGLAGYMTSAVLTGSYSTGNVSSIGGYVGGLAGYSTGGSQISDSYSTGTVSDSSSVGYAGGLVGESNGGSQISDSYSTGDVSSGGGYVGGFVGYVEASVLISGSHSAGNVFGVNYVGGLVGYFNMASQISNSYSTGNVSASSEVGGLVGGITFNSQVSSSYSKGVVSGSSNVGGLAGYDDTDGTVCSNSFWDNQTSNQSTSALCPSGGRTTAEMKTQSIFTGWDFDTNWLMSKAANIGYPYLQWQRFETIYSNFPSSTNFNITPNPNNVTNAVVLNSQGSITWLDWINVNGADFNSNAIIGFGFVSINAANLDSTLNSTANVTFTTHSCNALVIYHASSFYTSLDQIISNGVDCLTDLSCSNIQCIQGPAYATVTFTAAHFDGFGGSSGAVPEFSTITTVLALAIVLAGFFVIRKRI